MKTMHKLQDIVIRYYQYKNVLKHNILKCWIVLMNYFKKEIILALKVGHLILNAEIIPNLIINRY